MKPSKTFLALIILIIVSLGVYFGLMTKKAIQYIYGDQARAVKNCLLHFIEQNQGRFPQGQQDLIAEGYLKEEKGVILLKYPDPGTGESGWHKVISFQEFTVFYGAQTDQLLLKDETLCDRKTEKPVLLISGPYRLLVPYKQYSNELYKAMASEN